MRHKRPDFVDEYYSTPGSPEPKCCHTCDSYRKDGICAHYHAEPPEEFAATIGACPDFISEIPF